MTVCGKHGKTMKLFSHPSHSPWKSLRRLPHYHRHGYDEHEYLSKPVKTKTRRNDAQYHYPGGPNQMVKVGHAGIANSGAVAESRKWLSYGSHGNSINRRRTGIRPCTLPCMRWSGQKNCSLRSKRRLVLTGRFGRFHFLSPKWSVKGYGRIG